VPAKSIHPQPHAPENRRGRQVGFIELLGGQRPWDVPPGTEAWQLLLGMVDLEQCLNRYWPPDHYLRARAMSCTSALQLAKEPLITCRFREPFTDFLGRVEDLPAVEPGCTDQFEDSPAEHRGDGPICRVVVLELLARGSYILIPTGANNAYAAMDGSRAHVHEEAFRPESSVGFLEGMDHALGRHSSERPREHHDVEQARAPWEPFCGSDTIANPGCELLR